MKPILLLLNSLSILSVAAFAADPIQYQTRSENVRPLATDRPDQTDGVFTVPKGWWQFETGLANYSRRLDTDYRKETWIWGEVNAKYGITDTMDLQIFWQAYSTERYKGNSEDVDNLGTYKEGVTDLTIRLKKNLFGNDGGPWAMSVVPFIKIPTAKHKIGNDMWEGGISINSEIDLGGGWTLGNTIYSQVLADNDDTHYFSPAATAVLGFEVTDKLTVYGEFFAQNKVDTERFWQSSFDTGLMYMISPNVMFDMGANWFFRGDEAINPFVGLSWRF